MRLAGEAWRVFFDSFQREAFRLETRPVYDMASEREEYEQFLATGELHIPDEDPWLARVRQFRAERTSASWTSPPSPILACLARTSGYSMSPQWYGWTTTSTAARSAANCWRTLIRPRT